MVHDARLGDLIALIRGPMDGGRLVLMAVTPPQTPGGILVRKLARSVADSGIEPVLLVSRRWPSLPLSGWRDRSLAIRHGQAAALEETSERLRRAGRLVLVAVVDRPDRTIEPLARRADLILRIETDATTTTANHWQSPITRVHCAAA
jgi:hypothetical protein